VPGTGAPGPCRRPRHRIAGTGDTPRTLGPRQRQVTLAVGAVHPHPRLGQPPHQAWSRVSVGVVGTYGDERQPGAAGGEERRIRVAAAVVGHLEHVGAQVHALPAEARLGLRTQVAGQQDRESPRLGADHERQVVRRGRGRRPGRIGGEHLDRERPYDPPVAGEERGPRPPGPVHHPVEGAHPVVGGRERPGRDLPDVATSQGAREAAHVVGVEVGDQHQREGGDAQPVQAAVDRPDVGTCVDEDPGSGGGREHDRVPLPDVADDSEGVRRRPARRWRRLAPALPSRRRRPASPPASRPPRRVRPRRRSTPATPALRPARGR
jgi:hypothetical protein